MKRKIEKHRGKVLHSDSVLQRNAFVQPVPSSTKKKSNRKRKEGHSSKVPAEDGPKASNCLIEKRKGRYFCPANVWKELIIYY